MIDAEKPKHPYFCRWLAGGHQPGEEEPFPADSHGFVQLAEQEGVAPLLYWHYHHGRWPPEMPGQLRSDLVRAYYNTVAHNTLLLQELDKLLGLFSQADIPVMVLKGGALVDGMYDDVGLRPMHDLDLLIPENRIGQALALIQSIGYFPAEVEISPGIHWEAVHNTYWRGGPDGRAGLELHWNLIAGQADNRSVQADWFWQQLELVPGRSKLLAGRHLPQLHPTAHLLYLAAHLMLRHGGNNERLIWFYDVDRLVRLGRVDWAVFEAQAHTLGWGALARYVLQGAAQRFGTPLPPGLLEALAGEEKWQEFLLAHRKMVGNFSRLERTWASLRHFPWPLRLRMVLALFFPSPAYLRWRYRPNPVWVWPFYYLSRWIEILKELFAAVFSFTKKQT
jgi:hypothetical protein